MNYRTCRNIEEFHKSVMRAFESKGLKRPRIGNPEELCECLESLMWMHGYAADKELRHMLFDEIYMQCHFDGKEAFLGEGGIRWDLIRYTGDDDEHPDHRSRF